jgi:hypothetical protein
MSQVSMVVEWSGVCLFLAPPRWHSVFDLMALGIITNTGRRVDVNVSS